MVRRRNNVLDVLLEYSICRYCSIDSVQWNSKWSVMEFRKFTQGNTSMKIKRTPASVDFATCETELVLLFGISDDSAGHNHRHIVIMMKVNYCSEQKIAVSNGTKLHWA